MPFHSGADNAPMRRGILLAVLSLLAAKLVVDLLFLPAIQQRFVALWSIGRPDNYWSLAKNLWLGHGYRFLPDTSLTMMREPGYPLLLSGLLHLSDNALQISVVANLVIDTLSALIVAELARSIHPNRWVPLIAAVLFLLHPAVVIAELRSGVEIPFILALLVFLVLLRRALKSEAVGHYALCGVALGIASLIRSTALLFPPFLLLYAGCKWRTSRSVAQMGMYVGVLIGSTLLVLSPWIVRNYSLVQQFVPTATVQGVAMHAGYYICTHADGRKTFQDLDYDAVTERKAIAQAAGYRFTGDYYQFFYDPHDEVSFNKLLTQRVWHAYAQSPVTFARCTAENLFNFWFTGKNRTATIANICVQLPYLALALTGLSIAYKSADRELLRIVLLFVGYTVAVYAPIHAQARYSVPLVPLLALFAAVPIARLLPRQRTALLDPGQSPMTSAVDSSVPRRYIPKTFARFLLVGLLCTLLQYVVLVMLTQLWGVRAPLASTIGYVLSAVVNYLLSYSFTYQSTSPHLRSFLRFAITAGCGAALTLIAMYVAVSLLGINYLVAQVITTCLTLLWNFFVNLRWTF